MVWAPRRCAPSGCFGPRVRSGLRCAKTRVATLHIPGAVFLLSAESPTTSRGYTKYNSAPWATARIQCERAVRRAIFQSSHTNPVRAKQGHKDHAAGQPIASQKNC